MKVVSFSLLVLLAGWVAYPVLFEVEAVPELRELIEKQTPLPRYVEAGYSLLGRAPVVDAVLGDPFYLPTYAQTVAEVLKEASSAYQMSTRSFTAGGIPTPPIMLALPTVEVPDKFNKFREIYVLWQAFLQVNQEVKELLSVISSEEKAWLLENYEAFFFGVQGGQEYDFWTTSSPMPLKFFEMASRLDIAELAHCARKLALLVDAVYDLRPQLSSLQLKEDFTWEEQGCKLIISSRSQQEFTESANFFLSLGSHNHFKNNAGGAQGKTALHISLGGNNIYEGEHFVQGSGFLGVGLLANFAGGNSYQARSYSQGAGFMGVGILMDLESSNQYTLDFFGQSAAAFGASLLWNPQGGSTYMAHEGFAQAASSTLGVAFLVDGGNSHFAAGMRDQGGKRSSGIGQGGSMGVRHDPWLGHPSFYGGVSFLLAGPGHNSFQNSWFSQGSAYFMGVGILVDEGQSRFQAEVDSQGQGLHLAAGLLLQKGSHNYFQGGFGSLGVAADRSIGMLISLGGHNQYQGGVQSLGTSRKPEALGVLIDLQGENNYLYQESSVADIQRPASPLEWSKAFFLSLGHNNYATPRENTWGIIDHSWGIDRDMSLTPEQLFRLFPQTPRVPFPFDPIVGWASNIAYRPLTLPRIGEELYERNYEERRKYYESLDLFRFTHSMPLDLSPLLANPGLIPEDQFNYAALWALSTDQEVDLTQIVEALKQDAISSPYARQMAIKLIGKRGEAPELLSQIMTSDSAPRNRALAAYYLAKAGSLQLLQPAFKSPWEEVRYAAALGLQDSSLPEALVLVTSLFNDASFYVRRSAALTALSLKEKRGIPILLETLRYDTLDTTENYGDNIYAKLAHYVGVDFGLDKQAWFTWWEQNQESFAFPEICLNKNQE